MPESRKAKPVPKVAIAKDAGLLDFVQACFTEPSLKAIGVILTVLSVGFVSGMQFENWSKEKLTSPGHLAAAPSHIDKSSSCPTLANIKPSSGQSDTQLEDSRKADGVLPMKKDDSQWSDLMDNGFYGFVSVDDLHALSPSRHLFQVHVSDIGNMFEVHKTRGRLFIVGYITLESKLQLTDAAINYPTILLHANKLLDPNMSLYVVDINAIKRGALRNYGTNTAPILKLTIKRQKESIYIE